MVAGLLLAASFPRLSLAALAWIAPGLILAAAAGENGGRAFRVGYVAGLAHYLALLHWLLFIPVPVGAVAAWLALSAYLALYPACWVWLCWRFFPKATIRPAQNGDAKLAPVSAFDHFNAAAGEIRSRTWTQRTVWAGLSAIIWVAWEMIVGRFLTGFPWNFLGVSQYQSLPLIQIASITGVYGISFLIVWFSVSLFSAVLVLIGRPARRWAWLGEIILPLLAVSAVAAFGFSRLTRDPVSPRELKVALVQPSIPQTLIWNTKENPKRFQQIMRLSELALATRPDLLIWPEAALPDFTEQNFNALTNLIATHRTWMIFGADDAERNRAGGAAEPYLYFNAAFLFDPAGHYAATYHKQRLVIFGEYVPLARWLPFLKHLTPIGDGFTPGDRSVQFHLTRPDARMAILICFEDTFAALARESLTDDTDFLLNLTNDGWFGESAEQWQHAVNSVFRAVENGLPLVRCTNNGLTCWVDPRGGLHAVDAADARDVYGAGFKTARIPLLGDGPRPAPTFYRRHGDWFGWGCVGLTALAGMAGFPWRIRLRRWGRGVGVSA